MSWSASCKVPAGTKNDDIEPLLQQLQPGGQDNLPLERGRQLIAARAAAAFLIGSGAFGDLEKVGFSVRVTAHANPNHTKGDSASDFLSLDVSQMAAPLRMWPETGGGSLANEGAIPTVDGLKDDESPPMDNGYDSHRGTAVSEPVMAGT